MDLLQTQFIRSIGLGSQLPPSELPEVVFCGRSNVGKSTLINRLCNRKKLARVSSTPGKTTTINFFTAVDVQLVDLPGYGYAKRSQSEIKRWGQLMQTYFDGSRRIVLALLLLDSRREPNADDIAMLECFAAARTPFAAVLTKTDKLKRTQLEASREHIAALLGDYGPLATVDFAQDNSALIEQLRQTVTALVQERL